MTWKITRFLFNTEFHLFLSVTGIYSRLPCTLNWNVNPFPWQTFIPCFHLFLKLLTCVVFKTFHVNHIIHKLLHYNEECQAKLCYTWVQYGTLSHCDKGGTWVNEAQQSTIRKATVAFFVLFPFLHLSWFGEGK